MTLVTVTTEDGRTGYGEAKAVVGSAGVNGAVVASVEQELRPLLIGEDARQITRLWETMYSGSRAHFALVRGAQPAERDVIGRADVLAEEQALADARVVVGEALEIGPVDVIGLGAGIAAALEVFRLAIERRQRPLLDQRAPLRKAPQRSLERALDLPVEIGERGGARQQQPQALGL